MVDRNEWTVIGTASVDSGLIMIVDPCYVLGEKRWDKEAKDYGDVLAAFDEARTQKEIDNPERQNEAMMKSYRDIFPDGEMLDVFIPERIKVGVEAPYVTPWREDLGLVVHTLHGDGGYPILAQFNKHGQVTRLMIDFDPPYEDDEGEEDDYS